MRDGPTEHRFDAAGVTLAYFEWGEPDAPVILLLHATGFHARCWDRTVAALSGEYRVIAPEMRGHGRSGRRQPYVWDTFARDLGLLLEGLGVHDAVGVGHSFGGHCITRAAGRLPGVFQRLLLVDPVIADPQIYDADPPLAGVAGPEDHPVARRRNSWSSWQEMYAHFEARYPFSLWQRDVLEDYCRYGLRARGDGRGFELACPPLVEATMYMAGARTDIYDLIPRVTVPVVVLRARGRNLEAPPTLDFASSPTWEGVAARFPRGRDVFLPGLSHFIPMQDPELTARFIMDPHAVP